MKNHESAILVVLSYVIGFTTAFIMFVLADGMKDKGMEMASDSTVEMMDASPEPEMTLMETAEGLFLKTDGQERIISAHTQAAVASPGFYTDLVISSISPDDKFVHYCVEMEADSETCRHFVYSVAEDSTYMIKGPYGQIETPSSDASGWIWSSGSVLKFGEQTASADDRWILR